ncbi:MAG: hypothetical protein ACOCQ4_01725 [bacterium]
MRGKHKKPLKFSNHTQRIVGQPYYKKKPSAKKALNSLLNGLAKHYGTAWAPISVNGGFDLLFNQCPGLCGYVWKINIKEKDVVCWIVNEINQRKPFLSPEVEFEETDNSLKNESEDVVKAVETLRRQGYKVTLE